MKKRGTLQKYKSARNIFGLATLVSGVILLAEPPALFSVSPLANQIQFSLWLAIAAFTVSVLGLVISTTLAIMSERRARRAEARLKRDDTDKG